jgi:hypothetical protein
LGPATALVFARFRVVVFFTAVRWRTNPAWSNEASRDTSREFTDGY